MRAVRQLLADVAEEALANRVRFVTADDDQVGLDFCRLVEDVMPDGVGIGALHLGSCVDTPLGQAPGDFATEGVGLRYRLRFHDLLGEHSALSEMEHRHG